jgi:hypothetical protein
MKWNAILLPFVNSEKEGLTPARIDERSPIGEVLNKTMKQELIAQASGPAHRMEVAYVLT